MHKCLYEKVESDGYGTDWETACGHQVRCETPIEVGFCTAPLPNEDGKFCHFCGGVIELSQS